MELKIEIVISKIYRTILYNYIYIYISNRLLNNSSIQEIFVKEKFEMILKITNR